MTTTDTTIGINGMAHVILTVSHLRRRGLSTAGFCPPSA